MSQEISSTQISELEKLANKFGWKNLKVYHGGKVTSFEVTSFTPMERSFIEDLGFHLGGIQVYTRDNNPFMQISFVIKEGSN